MTRRIITTATTFTLAAVFLIASQLTVAHDTVDARKCAYHPGELYTHCQK